METTGPVLLVKSTLIYDVDIRMSKLVSYDSSPSCSNSPEKQMK